MTTTTHFSALATPRGANGHFAHEWRAGRWPVELPLPRVRAVRYLRLHPGSRCTFLYTVEGWQGAACIAKVYARPRPPLSQTLASLQAAGLTAPARHRVPEVIAELPALRLVLLRVAPGRTAADMLQDGDLEATARAGEWLGAFHTAPIALPTAYTLRYPLAQAARWHDRIARHLPALANRAGALHTRLLNARPQWPGEVRLIHGDFGAAHVFVAAETTTVIDWDSCRVGDPAEDGGRFIASLWHLAARERITRDDAVAGVWRFRAAYAAVQPRIAARLPFYAALACLRKAARLARHGERQQHQAEALLTAGQAEIGGVS
ncbi:MAG TPA: phosphotransferase [Ktedonobacterales bacterium]